jgi:hypothetical protein
MKKRDTYKNYLIKKLLGVDSTYYKPNPKYSRAKDAPMHLALIIDGIVEDIIHCDERLGYLLMSEPLVIELDNNSLKVNISDLYDEEANSFYKEGKNV